MRDKGGGGNLSFENREVEKEKLKEQRDKATAVCVLLSHDDYSSQVTQFWRALRKTARNTIIKTQ